ncbi:hypothetical protein R1sor_023325 [Riccia sorocarpa]|uniref:LysM domain-containing protein n=1 Tax=Riccia sorocarpa TaxID=122646 RepID=A0ABD3GPJ8_9MARC
MPGTIHVTVLEAVDLPAELKESPELLAVKVSLGSKEFTTRYRRFDTKSTRSWDSDFAFPVLNLKDKLGLALCDPEGKILTKCEIEVPSILQQGYREQYVELSAGGRLHVKLSFVLTDAERKKVNEMRAAAQSKKEKEQKDNMMVRRSNKLTKSIERAYDFKRKEDYCTDNGLRTIAENKEEHAGKPLDDWEVFSREKEKEVSPPACLFALPQPPLSPALKPSSPVDTGKGVVEVSADRERCSKNKYISPCSLVEGVLCHSSLNQDNIMEGTVRTLSSDPSTPDVSVISPVTEKELEADSKPPVDSTKGPPSVLSETNGQKENRPSPLTSVDGTCNMGSQDNTVPCPVPEMEECMESRLLDARQEVKKVIGNQGFSKSREENPFFPRRTTINNLVEADSPISDTASQSVQKEKQVAVVNVAPVKEIVSKLQGSSNFGQGVVPAVKTSTVKGRDVVRQVPRVKEVDRTSSRPSPQVIETPFVVQKSIGEQIETASSTLEIDSSTVGTLQVGDGSTESRAPGVEVKSVLLSSDVPTSKLRVPVVRNDGNQYSSTNGGEGACEIEEEIKPVLSSSNVRSPRAGLYHAKARQTGDSRILEPASISQEANGLTIPKAHLSSFEIDSPRLEQTLAKMEKSPGLLARLLSDDCTGTEEEVKAQLKSTTSAPIDGWVCVERPPMTWEDALRVAERELEVATAAEQATSAAFCLPSPGNVSTYHVAGPPSPLARVGASTSPAQFSLPSAEDIFAPLPGTPPKASRTKAGITAGFVKSHTERYESVLNQASGNVGNTLFPTKSSSPSEVERLSSGRRSAEEELLRWEERLRNWGQAAELKVIQEESAHMNRGRERQLSWDIDDFEDSIRKDFEARLQSPRSDSETTSSRLAVPAAEVMWDPEDTSRSKLLSSDADASTTHEGSAYLFDDFQVEDEESLMQEVSKPEGINDTQMKNVVLCEERRLKNPIIATDFYKNETIDTPKNHMVLPEERALENMIQIAEPKSMDDKQICTSMNDVVFPEEGAVEEVLCITRPKSMHGGKAADVEKIIASIEKVLEVIPLHLVPKKDSILELEKESSLSIFDPKLSSEARELAKTKSPSKLNAVNILIPRAISVNQLSFSEGSLGALKCWEKFNAEAKDYSLVSRFSPVDLQRINKPEALLAKAAVQDLSRAKADLIIDSLCKSLESAPEFLSPREQTPENSMDHEESKPCDEEKHKNALIGGALKQVLGGAVLVAGVFVLWPKNAGNTERYHIVKSGETLSNILPEQTIDPASKFCKLNPQVCERKTVYPGQRLRLG